MGTGNPKWVKGVSGNPNGRGKGNPNKTTGAVRELLKQALDEAGGKDAFLRYANSVHKEERIAFLNAVTKLIPNEVVGSGGGPLRIEIISLANQIAAEDDNAE